MERKPYRSQRFGIANHLGDIWTPETFATVAAAQTYLVLQGRTYPRWNLRLHKVVPVRVTISRTDAKAKKAPTP